MTINLDGIKPISDVIVTCLIGQGNMTKLITIKFPRPMDREVVRELQEVQDKFGLFNPLTGLDPLKNGDYCFQLVIKDSYSHLEIADRIVSHLRSAHNLSVRSQLQTANVGIQEVRSFT